MLTFSPLLVSPTLIIVFRYPPFWCSVMHKAKATLYLMEESSCVNNSPHLSAVFQILCLHCVLTQETSVSQWWVDDSARSSQCALRRTACLRFSREDVGGMTGESEFSMCIGSLELFQIFCSLGEECNRIPGAVSEKQRVKMLWKRWKQLLIFVSSARGGETAVCGAGKNMSSLSSVTHQLKSEFSFKTFYLYCLGLFWQTSWAIFLLAYKTAVYWKPRVNKLLSIAIEFLSMTFWLLVQVFPFLSSRGLKWACLSYWLTNRSCRTTAKLMFTSSCLLLKLVIKM